MSVLCMDISSSQGKKKNDGTYKPRLNEDGSIFKKTERKGAVCGHADGAREKRDLVDMISKLIGKPKYTNPSLEVPVKNKTRNNTGKTLCEEIEVLLRHLDLHDSRVSDTYRFFYRKEEYPIYKIQ